MSVRARRWVALLGLVIACLLAAGGAVQAGGGKAPPETIEQGFEPETRILNVQDYDPAEENNSSNSAVLNGELGGTGQRESGWLSWAGNHVGGLGLGLLEGAAIAVGVVAVGALLAVSAPVLAVAAGAAVIGGALYGAFVGVSGFNPLECAVMSLIGAVSAGVGASLAGAGLVGRGLWLARAAIDVLAGGLANVALYLFHTPDPSAAGATTAFGLGAGTAGLFLGGGYLFGKLFAGIKLSLGFGGGAGSSAAAMVDAVAVTAEREAAGAGVVVLESNPAALVRARALLSEDLQSRAVALEPPRPAAPEWANGRTIFTENNEFRGKKVYLRNDIDWIMKDTRGRTNLERAERGLAPLGRDGKPINLHHIGQRDNSPIVEVTATVHQKRTSVLHQYKGPSRIDRQAFDSWRLEYWPWRALTRRAGD